MGELEKYRLEIESIDEQLIALICKRMEVSLKIGEYKKQNNVSIYNPKREEELKNKNLQKVEKQYQAGCEEIFSAILKVSKDLQL